MIQGIYILTAENMDYLRGYVNTMQEYARAILDETAMIQEVLNDESKQHKPIATALSKVS